MSGTIVAPGARTFSAYAATAGVTIVTLVLFGVFAERVNSPGLNKLRAYAIGK